MDILKALLLGLVQGLTEFLPVSSSGHLEILNYIWPSTAGLGSDLFMVILVHFGTALSILYVFRKDIALIIQSLFLWRKDEHFDLAWKIILSAIPALIIGLLFEEDLELLFAGSIRFVAFFLMCTGLILWILPRYSKDQEANVSWMMAMWIGVAQAIAILPGISRSGATIACALMLGAARPKASRFSFLMVLPILLGKMFLDIIGGEVQVTAQQAIPFLVALLSAFLVGIVACTWMLKIVQKSELSYFAYYCFAVGAIVLLSTWL